MENLYRPKGKESKKAEKAPFFLVSWARKCIDHAVSLHHPAQKEFDKKTEPPVISPASKTAGNGRKTP